MYPLVISVCREISLVGEGEDENDDIEREDTAEEEREGGEGKVKNVKHWFTVGALLGVAYSCNIGGTFTLIGLSLHFFSVDLCFRFSCSNQERERI
jgi:hypothetical protein